MDPRNLTPSPENSTYGPFDPDREGDDYRLVESMLRDGFRESEPIILSGDGFILDGHRRQEAAIRAGVSLVPVLVEKSIRRDSLSTAAYTAALAKYNHGAREKTPAECVAEAALAADPEAAIIRLREHREARQHPPPSLMILPDVARRRADIGPTKAPLLAAATEIIQRLERFWPLSLRQIHYNLLQNPPPRNASRPRKRYRNDRASYQDLSDLLTRARLAGKIPANAIGDETRPVSIWPSHADARVCFEETIRTLFADFRRDYQRTQARHIELVAEKMTVQGILEPIAFEYGVPLNIGRGFASLPAKAGIVDRYRKSGKPQLVLLLIADLDPDGDALALDWPIALRDDFGLTEDELVPVRVAVTPEHVQQYGLPANGDANEKSSSRKADFLRRHGSSACYEIESLSPDVLQSLVRDAVESVLDRAAYDAEVEAERSDATHLELIRNRMLASV